MSLSAKHGYVCEQGVVGEIAAAASGLDDVQAELLLQATFEVDTADGVMRVRPQNSRQASMRCITSYLPLGDFCTTL